MTKTAFVIGVFRLFCEKEGKRLLADMFSVLRNRVERRARMTVRRVRVDRSYPCRVLGDTYRTRCINPEVLATAPKGEGDEVDVFLFYLDYDPTAEELEREMEIRGLKPDVEALASVNADSAFSDDHPTATQWRDKKGNFCCMVYGKWGKERMVVVNQSNDGWFQRYRFAGVRR